MHARQFLPESYRPGLERLASIGYIRLDQRLGPDELEALRGVCDTLLASAPPGFKRVGDFLRLTPEEPVARVEYLFDKHPAFLALAAHPSIVACATAVLGDEPVVTWEDLFVKQYGSTLEVPFHQDSLYQSRRSPVVRFGIYLDDSSPSPLRVLPGSHTLGALHADAIQEIVRARPDAIEEVSMGPGGILVHDTMLIHASVAHPDAPPRRVVYLEYRTRAQLAHDSPWDAQWIERRSRLLPAGRALRAQFPEIGRMAEGWSDVPDSIRSAVQDSLRVDHDEQARPDFHLVGASRASNDARHSA
mgnify:CR=1 FL=1